MTFEQKFSQFLLGVVVGLSWIFLFCCPTTLNATGLFRDDNYSSADILAFTVCGIIAFIWISGSSSEEAQR